MRRQLDLQHDDTLRRLDDLVLDHTPRRVRVVGPEPQRRGRRAGLGDVGRRAARGGGGRDGRDGAAAAPHPRAAPSSTRTRCAPSRSRRSGGSWWTPSTRPGCRGARCGRSPAGAAPSRPRRCRSTAERSSSPSARPRGATRLELERMGFYDRLRAPGEGVSAGSDEPAGDGPTPRSRVFEAAARLRGGRRGAPRARGRSRGPLLDERSRPGEQLPPARARGCAPSAGTSACAGSASSGAVRRGGHDHRRARPGLGPGRRTGGVRVLLLELDLRQPVPRRALGFAPPAVGLRRVPRRARRDVPVLRRRGRAGFWLLSAGGGAGSRGSPLPRPRLARSSAPTDRVFDYVVADCPPLLERRMPARPPGPPRRLRLRGPLAPRPARDDPAGRRAPAAGADRRPRPERAARHPATR